MKLICFGPVSPELLSQIFGDSENFVDIVGKDSGEVRPRVVGHLSAEGSFPDVVRVLYVPDLWHAAPGPEEQRQR